MEYYNLWNDIIIWYKITIVSFSLKALLLEYKRSVTEKYKTNAYHAIYCKSFDEGHIKLTTLSMPFKIIKSIPMPMYKIPISHSLSSSY